MGDNSTQELEMVPSPTLKEVLSDQSGDKNWFSRFSEKIRNRFQGEERTGEPKVIIDFQFGTHGSESDAKDLKKKITNCDIFIPELPGWTPKYLQTFREVSNGKITPQEALIRDGWGYHPMAEYVKSEFEALYKSKKAVAFADVPKDSKEMYDLLKTNHLSEALFNVSNLSQDFPDILRSFRVVLEQEAEAERQRESYILVRIKMEVEKLIAKNPNLRKKGEVRVFIPLGTVHTGVFHELKRQGQDVTRQFQEMPTLYAYPLEALRAMMFGKEVNDELLAHYLLSGIMAGQLGPRERYGMNFNEWVRFHRGIASKFSLEEIKSFIEEIKTNNFRDVRESLLGRIRQKDPESL